jgi:hypothetical protein
MRAVDVFMRRHGVGDLTDGKMPRERLLKQHPVRGRIVAKSFERFAYVAGRRRLGKLTDFDGDSRTLAGPREVAHVGEARVVLPDDDDREPR